MTTASEKRDEPYLAFAAACEPGPTKHGKRAYLFVMAASCISMIEAVDSRHRGTQDSVIDLVIRDWNHNYSRIGSFIFAVVSHMMDLSSSLSLLQ